MEYYPFLPLRNQRAWHIAKVTLSNESPYILQRAGEGIRTLDMQLGKLPLCQLSYTRVLTQFP